ncbi:ATP-dependent RNA helicase DDX42 [Frankliniella fusca]|uniref:ATP-dependent RNA helicase DDX42 n=1 Tax=Frankliniella fusca TaxID=407009 RepID=A0AAE1HYP6_9NEOP|nr:ATP-dependent RNA helicase DDX42 [Frankliniella fusca]
MPAGARERSGGVTLEMPAGARERSGGRSDSRDARRRQGEEWRSDSRDARRRQGEEWRSDSRDARRRQGEEWRSDSRDDRRRQGEEWRSDSRDARRRQGEEWRSDSRDARRRQGEEWRSDSQDARRRQERGEAGSAALGMKVGRDVVQEDSGNARTNDIGNWGEVQLLNGFTDLKNRERFGKMMKFRKSGNSGNSNAGGAGGGAGGGTGGGQLNGVGEPAAPAPAMFSKLKGAGGGAAQGHGPLDTNPISQYYEVGKQTACAGPGLIWKIYDAVRKSDRKTRVWKREIISILLLGARPFSQVKHGKRLFSRLYLGKNHRFQPLTWEAVGKRLSPRLRDLPTASQVRGWKRLESGNAKKYLGIPDFRFAVLKQPLRSIHDDVSDLTFRCLGRDSANDLRRTPAPMENYFLADQEKKISKDQGKSQKEQQQINHKNRRTLEFPVKDLSVSPDDRAREQTGVLRGRSQRVS